MDVQIQPIQKVLRHYVSYKHKTLGSWQTVCVAHGTSNHWNDAERVLFLDMLNNGERERTLGNVRYTFLEEPSNEPTPEL